MPVPHSPLDPQGYYDRLDVSPAAATAEIAAAFRRKARRLHPDVPGTGNTAAFVAAREAYDVLSDPVRRAAYDRTARQATLLRSGPERSVRQAPSDESEVGEIPPMAAPVMPEVPMRHPRWSDLPLPLWVGAGLVILVSLVQAVVHFSRVEPPKPVPMAALMPAAPSGEPAQADDGPAPVQLPGSPNYYVAPGAGPATLWRREDGRDGLVPVGKLPPFSTLQAVRMVPQSNLVEVRVGEAANALVEAGRLSPGDAATARRNYCAYNAGLPPRNGEVLERRGSGPGRLKMRNHSPQPAVVKLRGMDGGTVASIYLLPGGEAELAGLPLGVYRPDVAIGELWSRTCGTFAAGMRAQRLADLAPLSSLDPLAIPLDTGGDAPATDITDQAFEAE